MTNIEYMVTNESDLDSAGRLWQKLNEYHQALSPHMKKHFSEMTFDRRKQWLLEKTKNGKMRIEFATDTNTGEAVGFCISSVAPGFNGEQFGEIDTIFVEEDYRKTGIGDNLMKHALEWMESLSAKRKRIIVAVGNENVLSFYRRYGFLPGIVTLMQMGQGEEEGNI